MASRHRFIDSAGTAVEGKAACLDAWRGFFAAFPDYRNEVSVIAVDGPIIAMAGRSHCSDSRLDGSALWRAAVDAGLLTEWQVLDDLQENRVALGLPA
jgi:hypothetical protein